MVSLILFLICGTFFLFVKKRMVTGYVYFAFLAFMLLPPQLDDGEAFIESWFHEVDAFNIIVLAICLCVGYIPWKIFDTSIFNRSFQIPIHNLNAIKRICFTLIVLSLLSIIYLFPVALRAIMLGASDVRAMLYGGEYDMLPKSPFTTIAVATAALNIYCVLFFYICYLRPELKKYRIWLAISSLSYVINCFAITARDGLIFLPVYYIIFYLVFRKSFKPEISVGLKATIKRVALIAGIFMAMFSLSRFAGNNEETDWDTVYSGTFGYISQQPYVFDATVKGQDDFWGFERRFPLVNRMMGISEYRININEEFEWSFGTMYSEHYSISGWASLIGLTLVYVLYYALSMKYLAGRRRYFSLLLMFTVFMFIAVSGMFYTRAGGNVNMNLFYLTLSIIPFFVPNIITSKN